MFRVFGFPVSPYLALSREISDRTHELFPPFLPLLCGGSLQAAELRKRDNTACASGADAQREAAKAAKESVKSNAIDLTLDSDQEIQTTNTSGAGPSRPTPSRPDLRPRNGWEPSAQTPKEMIFPSDPRFPTSNFQTTEGTRPDPTASP